MTQPRSFPPRRNLGATGFAATQLGIGDIADRRLSKATLVATLHRAMHAGLNVIDTAPMYEAGYSEEIVGEALRGRRAGMFVIDKVDLLENPVAPQVEASLRKLQLDQVDAFVLHGISALDQWRSCMAAGGAMAQLAACIQAGKARFKGISAHHPEVLRDAIKGGLCDLVMFPVGPFVDSRYVSEILPLARTHGVGTVCFKTFGAGKLIGDTEGYNQPLQVRPRGKISSGGADNLPRLPHLTAAECLHYTLTCDPDVALLGLSYPNEQDAAFAALTTFRPLKPAMMADIRARAIQAMAGKGRCWWNPPEGE